MAHATTLPPGHPPRSAVGGLVLTRDVETPLGPMLAGAVEDGVCLLEFNDRQRAQRERRELDGLLGGVAGDQDAARELLDTLCGELVEYFAGGRRGFSVPLVMPGTDFERAVWERLLAIPAGETRSYGQLAVALGDRDAARAVGRANGRNRIAIVVPCHRVINTGGGLGGYGGGLHRKKWLVEHERRVSGVAPGLFDAGTRMEATG